ncbi:hypothetical protein NKG05_16340 [Oerskovia sp. M15]
MWRAPKTSEDILVILDEQARRQGLDERPSATATFGTLAESLVFADRHHLARPLIQYFAPQWALTETALVAPDHAYDVRHDRVDRVQMDLQVKAKTWLDDDSYDEAHSVADALFPLTAKQEKYATDHPR